MRSKESVLLLLSSNDGWRCGRKTSKNRDQSCKDGEAGAAPLPIARCRKPMGAQRNWTPAWRNNSLNARRARFAASRMRFLLLA
jgi:hypothetical protein